MSENVRHPFRNFFVKKSIQTRIIVTILFSVIVAALLSTGVLTFVYNAKAQHGSFYYMSNDIMQDLELKSMLGIILPSLLVAQSVTIMLAFGIGLFSSRKVAVPLYKIEKWAARLSKGNLNTRLAFREGGEMRDLTIQCNAVAEFYQALLIEVRSRTEAIGRGADNPALVRQQVDSIDQLLRRVEL